MPIFFQQVIDSDTSLAVWKIAEEEPFFNVPLQRAITHPHKRLQHLAGRYLLRYLFPAFPLDLIKIADTRKPYLEDEAYHFSISHCSDYAAAIVSKSKRVGIDIEVPTHKIEAVKHKFLHEAEQAAVERDDHMNSDWLRKDGGLHQQDIYKLTLLWSAKEAVFKWWSYGNVSFREMIRLQPAGLQPCGCFDAFFHSEDRVLPLEVHYRFFPALCLAWIVR